MKRDIISAHASWMLHGVFTTYFIANKWSRELEIYLIVSIFVSYGRASRGLLVELSDIIKRSKTIFSMTVHTSSATHACAQRRDSVGNYLPTDILK